MHIRNILLILALIAAAMLFITPLINPFGSFTELDGSVGIIDHLDLWKEKDPITCITYFIGDFFCPQQSSRSFELNGSQLAFCSRDVSILIGFIIGCIISFIVKISRIEMRNAVLLLGTAFILMMSDWFVQHFADLNIPATRVITGCIFGIAVAILIAAYDIRTTNTILIGK